MSTEIAKKAAADAAAQQVEDGMLVGLGTGSTAAFFLDSLAGRMRDDNLRIHAVATSLKTEMHARDLGIPVVPFGAGTSPDLTVDGADEIGPRLTLIKGGGGALVREKIVATASKRMLVIADATKCVRSLGSYPLPVAVVPWAAERLAGQIAFDFEVRTVLRANPDGQPLVTDDQLWILDLHFGTIRHPALLEQRLRQCTGLVECGLFVDIATEAIVAGVDGGCVRWSANDDRFPDVLD
jgi:ribose 5-phosphate isomerase A